MSSQQPEEDPINEKLKASLWFAIGKLIDEECLRLNTTATPQFIGAMTEMAWAQLESVATDLESFSRHASRTTATSDDVLLVTRRNDALHGIMRDFVEGEKREKREKERERKERERGAGGERGRGRGGVGKAGKAVGAGAGGARGNGNGNGRGRDRGRRK